MQINKYLRHFFVAFLPIIALLAIGIFASLARAEGADLLIRSSADLLPNPPPTDAVPPLSDVGQLFTPEVILALVFLLTMPLTTLIKHWFRLEGDTANIITNVVLNAIAKGITLVVAGQATWQFAVVAFVLGVALDKTIYDLLTRGKQEQIAQLEKDVVKPEPYGDGDFSRQP